MEFVDDGGSPLVSQTVKGWMFDAANVQSPLVTWTFTTDANGRITVPVEPVFSVGDTVWSAASIGSFADTAAWQAHFAPHRVQEV